MLTIFFLIVRCLRCFKASVLGWLVVVGFSLNLFAICSMHGVWWWDWEGEELCGRPNFWPLFSFFGVKGMLDGLRIRLDSMLLIGAKV